MKAITPRSLPEELARRLRRKADREGLSLNRAVIAALEQAFGLTGRKRASVHHDLDFLVGSLSKEDGVGLERSIKTQRRIDREVSA